jgi:hypothetical protein
MPLEERVSRWRALTLKVEIESAAAWCRDFLAELSRARTQISMPAELPDLSG